MSRKFDASLSSIVYYYTTMKFADSDVKCKPYSEITVEIGTHLKTVKITLNIFAVHARVEDRDQVHLYNHIASCFYF